MTTLEHLPPGRRPILTSALGVVGLAAAFALGMGLVLSPTIGLGVGAIVLFVPLLLSPLARLIFVVGGAMAVLSVSNTLSASKIAYLLGSGLVVGIALVRLSSLRGTKAYAEAKTLLHVSFFFGAFVIIEMTLALAAGISGSDVLREGASYLLYGCIPLLALDARNSPRSRLIGPIFVIVALIATLSYAVEFLTYRSLTQLPIDRIALAGALPAALFCYLSAGFLLGQRRIVWAVAAGFVLALIVVAANRGGLIVLVGPLAISLVGGGRDRWRKCLRLVVVGALVGLLALWGVGLIGRAFDIDTSYLSRRYATLLHPSDLRSDPSVNVRLAQTRSAWEVFRSDPILGAGPGYVFVWSNPFTHLRQSYLYIDSPLQFPAKFGVVGILFWLSFLIAYGLLLLRLNRAPTVYRAAALGFAATLFAWTFIGSPMSDKGAALGLLMLLALSLTNDEHLAGRAHPRSAHLPSATELSEM